MHNLVLRGTPADMGHTHGILLRGALTLPWDSRLDALAEACEREAIRLTPDYVEEMEAFAEAAEMDPKRFKAFTLCASLGQTLPSCSVVAVLPERSASGKLMVGRNYDFDYGISLESATTYHTYPNNGLAHVGNSDIWIGREDGMNEARLFVAMSATFMPGAQAGLPFWFVVRYMLEHCHNVEEAKAWIADIPHAQSRNYMLADANTAVVVEASINGVRVRKPEDGILAMTNHPEHPDWARTTKPQGDSLSRNTRLRALASDVVRERDLIDTLNDRSSGVCAYAQWGEATYGTIWSVVATPAEGRFELAEGVGAEGAMTYSDVAAELRATMLQPT